SLGEHDLGARGERDRRLRGRARAVSREVERERPIAFGIQALHHAVPRPARPAEAVEQHHRLAHFANRMTPATDTYVRLRASVDELARSGMRAACTAPGSR